MPGKPKRICNKPGCRKLTIDRYCDEHKGYNKQTKRQADRWRGNSNERGYTYAWSKAREAYLQQHPYCAHCLQQDGRYEPATVVDHIIPHKGDKTLFWDRDNWQALCARHHNMKTAREDGGFGRGKTI